MNNAALSSDTVLLNAVALVTQLGVWQLELDAQGPLAKTLRYSAELAGWVTGHTQTVPSMQQLQALLPTSLQKLFDGVATGAAFGHLGHECWDFDLPIASVAAARALPAGADKDAAAIKALRSRGRVEVLGAQRLRLSGTLEPKVVTDTTHVTTVSHDLPAQDSPRSTAQSPLLQNKLDELERLRLATEVSSVGTWERGLGSSNGYWDATMFRLFGLEPRPTAPKRRELLALVHPDDRPAVESAWQRMRKSNQVVEFEFRVARGDGQWAHLNTRGVIRRNAQGRALRTFGTTIDISAIRSAERRLREIDEWLRLTGGAIGVGFLRLGLDQSTQYCDRQAKLLFGFDPDGPNPSYEQFLSVIEPADHHLVQAARARSLTTTEPIEVEYRIRLPDGRQRYLFTRRTLLHDEHQQPLYVVAVVIDTTAARTAELNAQTLLQRMQLTTSAAGMGLWEFDLDNNLVVWDEQMYQLHGRQRDELPDLRRQWIGLVHPDDREHALEQSQRSLELAEPLDIETRILLPDGSVRHLAHRAQLQMSAQGRARRQVGVTWDITERKMTESAVRARDSAQRASRAKSEFLSRMSHELRTPLNAILGFTQILELDPKHPLSSEQRERVEHIKQAGWHLLTLINEILDLSTIEAGATRMAMAAVSVTEVIDECLALINTAATQRQLSVQVKREPGAPLIAWADRTRLKQVLLNLLTNAVKYNREQGHILLKLSRSASGELRLAVRDTGLGLTTDQMDKLFQPFNRLGLEHASIEGTGIGLTIALQLVEQMGGTLTVSSESGVGSEFALTLQSTSRDGAARRSRSRSATTEPPIKRNDVTGSVLCIEDNPANLALIEQMLSLRPQVTLFKAADGASARVLAAVCQPDLILLDMHLPDTDGLTLLRELRTQHHVAHTPCIAISANALPGDIAQAHQAGITVYLTKPLSAEEFLRNLDTALGQVTVLPTMQPTKRHR